MDSFYKKTRRPHVALSSALKRPPPSVTPPKCSKIPNTPSTPKEARLVRPLVPPPLKTKQQLLATAHERKRPISVRALFKSVHSPEEKPVVTISSPLKISSGPLKGISTSLLDTVRAKEAAANAVSPEEERRRELLGLAPEIVRIVPTVFTSSKREILRYDYVIDKCFKSLKSNYTSQTIIECLDLMGSVAPDWISIVTISRGKYMRINQDKYSIPQLSQAIRNYKV